MTETEWGLITAYTLAIAAVVYAVVAIITINRNRPVVTKERGGRFKVCRDPRHPRHKEGPNRRTKK